MSFEVNPETTDYKGKYLTFNLMEEFYGVNVEWILQIIAIPDIIKIPNTPDFIKGVINLRGKIIPVIDLRQRFRLHQQSYDDRTSIVITRLSNANGEVYIGIIVDQVLEVLDIHTEEIENTPAFGVEIDTQFILCMAKVKGKIVTLLNIYPILKDIELAAIKKTLY